MDGSGHSLRGLRGDSFRGDSLQMRRQSDSWWGMPSTEFHDRHDKRHVELFEGFVTAPVRKQHSEKSLGRRSSLHGEDLPPSHKKHGGEMRRSSIRCGQGLVVYDLGIRIPNPKSFVPIVCSLQISPKP